MHVHRPAAGSRVLRGDHPAPADPVRQRNRDECRRIPELFGLGEPPSRNASPSPHTQLAPLDTEHFARDPSPPARSLTHNNRAKPRMAREVLRLAHAGIEDKRITALEIRVGASEPDAHAGWGIVRTLERDDLDLALWPSRGCHHHPRELQRRSNRTPGQHAEADAPPQARPLARV